MKIFHDSKNSEYRKPFGALETGKSVTLGVKITEEAENVSFVSLRIWIDKIGEIILPMEKVSPSFYQVTYTPKEPCIVWYSFLVNNVRYTKCGNSDWQITCYKKRTVPSWYKNAIVYQIFPDRFYKGNYTCKLPAKNGIQKVIVSDWSKEPKYKKDENGSITEWEFYGGNLNGIIEKLPYLKEMGITAVYLNPIFSSASNHRYDTADYENIDILLGNNDIFKELCQKAKENGIHIILDGVFNHTGCDSIYFDKYKNYGTSEKYKDWFTFDSSPVGYKCWWGVSDLPAVNKNEPGYRDFIKRIVRKWLNLGASGWRLDVADELPDDFIEEIKNELRDDEVLLGEVWEDASNKISYGQLRRYFLGSELDGVMNYPVRNAVIAFLTKKISAFELADTLKTLMENYPPEAFYSCLNLLSSHDRPRILTELGNDKNLLWLAVLFIMSIPGVPCIYYGDEAGLTGQMDPGNRKTFPWSDIDNDCQNIYHNAIVLRKTCSSFTDGSFEIDSDGEDIIKIIRENSEEKVTVIINRTDTSDIIFERKTSGLCKIMPKGLGVLCHTTSLPNGLKDGYKFVDWLKKHDFSYWQILPLNIPDKYGSPYAGLSAFDIIYSEEEWLKVKKYANDNGISIIGDLPIYLSPDSVDVKNHPEYFDLTKKAGVPPDRFSKTGQNWSNPLYNWDKAKDFWLKRFEQAFKLYDYVRIDHFRGFLAYYSFSDKKWILGPGYDLFKKAYKKFGPLPIIAEDLGIITDAVNILRKKCNFLGMDVLQFRDSTIKENCILYTGTHDNETLLSFCNNDRIKAKETLKNTLSENNEVKIYPIQDLLLLGNESRMNTPGTTENNWKFKFTWEELDNAEPLF